MGWKAKPLTVFCLSYVVFLSSRTSAWKKLQEKIHRTFVVVIHFHMGKHCELTVWKTLQTNM